MQFTGGSCRHSNKSFFIPFGVVFYLVCITSVIQLVFTTLVIHYMSYYLLIITIPLIFYIVHYLSTTVLLFLFLPRGVSCCHAPGGFRTNLQRNVNIQPFQNFFVFFLDFMYQSRICEAWKGACIKSISINYTKTSICVHNNSNWLKGIILLCPGKMCKWLYLKLRCLFFKIWDNSTIW